MYPCIVPRWRTHEALCHFHHYIVILNLLGYLLSILIAKQEKYEKPFQTIAI